MPQEVAFGQVSSPNGLNQLVDILQRRVGQQETGAYYLDSWSAAVGDEMGAWVQSQSRGTTPVSVSIDTSLQVNSFCNAPSTNTLTSNGFHVFTTASSINNKMYVGGLYTINY
jgi:hypothetical protein